MLPGSISRLVTQKVTIGHPRTPTIDRAGCSRDGQDDAAGASDVAGIEVTLQNVDNSVLITDVLFGKHAMADFSVYSWPDPDPDRYFWGSQTALGGGEVEHQLHAVQHSADRQRP